MTAPLSQAATAASQRRGAAPRFLMAIEFRSPAVTLRFSDQDFTSLLGAEWEHYVESWGTLAAALNTVDVGGKPTTFEVTFLNTKPIRAASCLSDLIRTPDNPAGYEWAFAKATVSEVLDPGHVAGDEVVRGVFYVEDPTDIGEELLTIKMSDQSFVLEDQLRLLTISEDDFPNAEPAAIGKKLGPAFGTLTGVPCHFLVAGGKTTLAAAAAVGATTLTLSSTASLPSSGTLQIDDEQKTYTGKTATTVTGGSALTKAHVLGAAVFEVRSGSRAYRCAPCINILGGISAISAVYINGVRTTAFTTTLADTSLKDGFSIPTIDFAGVPFITPQGNVDTLAVTSNSTTTLVRVAMNQPVSGGVGFPSSGGSNFNPLPALSMPSLPAGTVVQNVTAKLTYTITSAPGVSAYRIERGWPGPLTTLESGTSGVPLGQRTVTWGKGTSYSGEQIVISASGPSGGGSMSVTINSLELTVEALVQVSRTGTITLSGSSSAEVLFGTVTCDLVGIKDDTNGTITGTASTVLTNPTDITTAIMTQLYPDVAISDFGLSRLATRSAHAAAGYEWAFVLEWHQFSRLRRKLGEQARAILYLEAGTWEYVYLVDTPATAVTLDYANDLEQPGKLRRTPRADVKNSLTVHAGRDYTKTGSREDIYTIADLHEDLQQGVPRQPGAAEDDRLQDFLELDFVQSAATAALVGAHELGQRKRQRFLIEDVVAYWNVIKVQTTDYVAIENHPRLDAHGGAGVVFRVLGRKDLGDGRHALTLKDAA